MHSGVSKPDFPSWRGDVMRGVPELDLLLSGRLVVLTGVVGVTVKGFLVGEPGCIPAPDKRKTCSGHGPGIGPSIRAPVCSETAAWTKRQAM
jgi:hypothetical protein